MVSSPDLLPEPAVSSQLGARRGFVRRAGGVNTAPRFGAMIGRKCFILN